MICKRWWGRRQRKEEKTEGKEGKKKKKSFSISILMFASNVPTYKTQSKLETSLSFSKLLLPHHLCLLVSRDISITENLV